MKLSGTVILIAMIALVSSCGYKSDLYLPKKNQGTAANAQQDQDQQRKKNDASGQQEQK